MELSVDKPCDSFASCSSRTIVRMGQSIIFARKQASGVYLQGAAFQVKNAQLTTYVEKRKAIRGRPKLQEIRERGIDREKTHAGVWQTLQLCTHNTTLMTASRISLQSYTLQQPESS